jgi:hypothetical protein
VAAPATAAPVTGTTQRGGRTPEAAQGRDGRGRAIRLPTRLSRPRERDPYWDLDGFVARRERSQTARLHAIERLVMLLAATLLVLILAHLPEVNARDLVHGTGQPVLVTSLTADVVACMLVLVHQLRSRRPTFVRRSS